MSDIKGLREISNDPFGKLLTALSKKFSAFLAKDQAEQVENPEDIYGDGQDVESAIKYHNFVMSKKFNLTTNYYSATEPDYDKLRLWIKVYNLGNTMREMSGFNNTVTLFGDPTLVDGAPFDSGVFDGALNTKSLAVRFNRPTSDLVNREYIQVTDNINIQMSAVTGFSLFFRFKIYSLSTQNGFARTLYLKYDNATTAIMIQVDSSGRFMFHVKRGGSEYNNQTATTTIAINTVYEVWLTYTYSGNVFHVYVNNVDKTLTSAGTQTWATATTNSQIMRRDATTGYFYGDLYDVEYFWRVVSTAEVGYHYTNKWTLANIPFGQVAISNYSCTVSP